MPLTGAPHLEGNFRLSMFQRQLTPDAIVLPPPTDSGDVLPDIADLVGGPSGGQAVEDALSEDDSDAAFAARHALLEAQEHAKFQTLAGGLPVAWCGLAVMWQGLSRVWGAPNFPVVFASLGRRTLQQNRTGTPAIRSAVTKRLCMCRALRWRPARAAYKTQCGKAAEGGPH